MGGGFAARGSASDDGEDFVAFGFHFGFGFGSKANAGYYEDVIEDDKPKSGGIFSRKKKKKKE